MKTICLIMLLMLVLFMVPVKAEKVATLHEIMKPDMITMGDDRLYITERTSIYIYSLKDYSLIKKFGKEGEGPKEFQIVPLGPPMLAYPYKGKIYVSSNAKISTFTGNGEFIKESKILPFQVYRPAGDNKFVFTATSPGEKNQTYLSVNLADENFQKIKELYVSDMTVGQTFSMSFPFSSFQFVAYKNRVYVVAGKEGFAIAVYDLKGTELYRVKKEEEQINVPSDYKKKTLDWFQKDPGYKQGWEYFKTRISFKDQYPAIQDMEVTDDMIYVLTYKQREGKTECIVMDLKGNEKKRLYVDVPEIVGMDFYAKYGFYKKHYYTLVENADEETWELNKIPIIK
ncbi:MAG: hypothetical protein GY950_25370 [bacterium]|nr:hypothetical protein [bacterium]